MAWVFRHFRRSAVANDPAAPDNYIFGESDAEISRLNFQHYMFRLAFGGDYSAPIKTPGDILDVACGTGRWVRDVARRFPETNVIGFDW
jgi:tRNA G46 methylase TrmB